MPSIDADVLQALGALTGGQAPPPPPAKGDWQARRTTIDVMFGGMAPPMPASIKTKDYTASAEDGHEIVLRWYTKKKDASKSGSAVLYLHGGGFIAGSLKTYDGLIAPYVEATGVPFLGVEYRLAPEHPYPTGLLDGYAALLWLVEHASELGVEASRIAVMGDSAGGGLAAAVAIHSVQNKGPSLAKQILIYPTLDERNMEKNPYLSMATWSAEDNETAWDVYLGSKDGSDDVPATAAPVRVSDADAAALPPAYIDLGDLDHLAPDSLTFTAKLMKNGVNVEMHMHPGCAHGFDVFAASSDVVKRTMADRCRVISGL